MLCLRVAHCSRFFLSSQLHLYPLVQSHSCSNRNLNLNAGLNIDNDLLYNFRWRIQINQALVNSHLEHIPSLASLTAGCLAGGDFEGLGGESDRTLDSQVLGFGALKELGADFFE